ncbi:TRAP transporter small permease [Phaeovulum sp. W22_SRMD_FR3]|uniref:TRAP transporter small permease n=1 Tax=Phaeovulum sp. W22_SRMD_FR3 TaxID=3240274 RepID=UPI003F9A38BF
MIIIQRLDRILSGIETALIVGLTLSALGLAFLQVVLRYVFNTGLHWLEAALVIALVWAMLIGAVRAVRDGMHPRVELLAQILPARPRAVLNVLALAAAFGLSIYVLKDAVFYAGFLRMVQSIHPELGIPDIYPFLIIPIATGLMALRQALVAWALWSDPAALEPDRVFAERMDGRTHHERSQA